MDFNTCSIDFGWVSIAFFPIDLGWVSIASSKEFEWISIRVQLILDGFRRVTISFSMDFEWFAMHFQLRLVCFVMGSPMFSIGLPFVFEWVPLIILLLSPLISWFFCCFGVFFIRSPMNGFQYIFN